MLTSIRMECGSVAEPPVFESPVSRSFVSYEGRSVEPRRSGAALTLHDVSATTKLIVRAGPETVASHQMDASFGTSRTEEGVLVIGQRPDEWVIMGPAVASRALVDGLDRSGHVSVIDHTHSRALFRLTGAEAASVLEKLCSLDWSDDMTPDGAAVSASVAKVTSDIVRNDIDGTLSYLISCDRSYGQYLFDAILDARHEFGIGPLVASVS